MEWDSQLTDCTFLVTGSAGFIGFHVAQDLLARGARVVGLDNYNDYYSPALKRARDHQLRDFANFVSIEGDLADLPTPGRAVSRPTGPRRSAIWPPRPGCATP